MCVGSGQWAEGPSRLASGFIVSGGRPRITEWLGRLFHPILGHGRPGPESCPSMTAMTGLPSSRRPRDVAPTAALIPARHLRAFPCPHCRPPAPEYGRQTQQRTAVTATTRQRPVHRHQAGPNHLGKYMDQPFSIKCVGDVQRNGHRSTTQPYWLVAESKGTPWMAIWNTHHWNKSFEQYNITMCRDIITW